LSIHDERRSPFCWQEHAAVELIRRSFSGAELKTALAVYLALTYVASNRHAQGGRDGFAAGRKEVAAIAGIKPETFDKTAVVLAGVGLIEKRPRTDEFGRDMSPLWVLPPGDARAGTPPGGSTTSGGYPDGPLGDPPDKRARVTQQEEDKLPTSLNKGQGVRKGDGQDFPPDLPEKLRPVAVAVAERLASVAAQRPGCIAVKLGAVARAIRDSPGRDHAGVAGDLEHWLLYGNGQGAQCKDVVSRYRRFLDGSPEVTSGGGGNVTPIRRAAQHPASKRISELEQMKRTIEDGGRL
jgi:hypothetical protein